MEEEKQKYEKIKEKSITPIARSLVQRKLALFSSRDMADDLYYFLEAINLLIKDIGEDFLENYYGKDVWSFHKNKIKKLSILVNKVKVYYDSLTDKKWKEDRKEIETKKVYIRALSKIPIFEDSLYDVFNVLLNNTKLKYMTIRSEYFKVLDREKKVIDLTKDMDKPEELKKEEIE